MEKVDILILGDSHAMVFNTAWFKFLSFLFINQKIEVVSVEGATISGIENPNSKTNASSIFAKAIQNIQAEYCFTLIGEVDTGFVLWYKADKNNIEVSDLLPSMIEKMEIFLKNISVNNGKPIFITTPLPTITDKSRGSVASLRSSINIKQEERTKLTLDFNRKMINFCMKKGFNFINLDPISLNRKGLVKRILKHYKSTNHHYNVFFLFVTVSV